jgi:predicted nucleic acid-binding protein
VTRLEIALASVTRLALDTPPVIYYVECNPRYEALVDALFAWIEDQRILGVTSVVTLAEVLVAPLARGDLQLAAQYRALFEYSGFLRLEPITRTTAERAAALRARHRLRLGDALQVALALQAGCEAFLTTDRTLHRITELRVLVLDELET